MIEQTSIFDFINHTSNSYKINKPIRLIELFAGIGSQAKALKNIGANFEHYKVVEFDKYAIASYNAIHNTNFTTQDITKISGNDLEIVDTDKYTYLLTYSFPCQDLSIAGNQKGMTKGTSTRSGLLWEVERLLNETKELPQVLLMENVPQIHSTKNRLDFDKWIEFLQSKGYCNYWQDLNAKDYGIPQNRNRTFMVSILGSYEYEFPYQIEEKSVDNFLRDLFWEECWECCPNDTKSRRKIYDENLKIRDEKGNLAKYILTITTKQDRNPNSGVIYFPHTLEGKSCFRYLTPRETLLFMGFSDDDYENIKQYCSKDTIYKQAGNSIVVNVLEEIFKKLLNIEEN